MFAEKMELNLGPITVFFDWHHPSQERNVNGKDAKTPWANNKMKEGKKA